MKYTTLKAFSLVGLLVLLAAASVQAQTRNVIKANIPFDFGAGGAKLKAGEYIIERIDRQSLVLTSVNGKERVFALTSEAFERTRNSAQTRLVFHHSGDMYFLSEAWIDGNGNWLSPSKAERSVARELAKDNRKLETTEVVARAR